MAEMSRADEMQAAMNRIVRDNLFPLFAGVAGIYVFYVVLDLWISPTGGPTRMTYWSAGLGALFAAIAAVVKYHQVDERYAHPLVGAVALIVLVRLLDDLRWQGPLRSVTDLNLYLVATGSIVLSRRWLTGISVIAVSCWIGELILTVEDIRWYDIAFSLCGAITLSYIVQHMRRKTYRQFEKMRRADAQKNETLARSEMRFRRIYESDAIGIIIGTFDGELTAANDAFRRMMGYERGEPLPRWDAITPAEFLPLDRIAVDQLLRTGTAAPFQKEYIHKDGRRIPILFGCGVLDADKHEAMAFVLDLSAIHAAREKIDALTEALDQAGRLGILGEMAAGIAHDLKQPLTSIASDAEAAAIRLEHGETTKAELIQRLTMIADDALTASDVIEKVKTFISRKEVQRTLCDLGTLMNDALHFTRSEARRRGVQIELRTEPSLPPILVDGLQIMRVVLNLVLNAIQATSEKTAAMQGRKPCIKVDAVRCGEDHVEIVVRDNGPGISDDIRGRIFQQFVTTRDDGLGLGLAMCKSLVESHAGELTFTSVPGETTFRVLLPIAAELLVRPPSSESLPQFQSAAGV